MPHLKRRDPRKPVRIDGRLRRNYDWVDLRIRNLSTKGLMAEAKNPPGRGHYIEIRRHDQIMVGQVVWQIGEKFGARLAQEIDIAAVADDARNEIQIERRNHEIREKKFQAKDVFFRYHLKKIKDIAEVYAYRIFGIILLILIAVVFLDIFLFGK